MSIPDDNWNNRLKEITEGLTKFIPGPGKAISLCLKLFWPTDKSDIFSLLVDQITELVVQIVDAALLKQEQTQRMDDLLGMRDSMEHYVNEVNSAKAFWLAPMLVNCNTIFEKFDNSLNDVQLLPLAIVHAYQHILLLREQVLYGKELYGEDNTEFWMKEIHDYVQKYTNFFVTKMTKWEEWRKKQLKEKYWEKGHHTPYGPHVKNYEYFCDITDALDKNKAPQWQYHSPVRDPSVEPEPYPQPKPTRPIAEKLLQRGVEMIKERVFSESRAELVKNVYVPSFHLGRFIPGHEEDSPKAEGSAGVVTLGPFSSASLGYGEHFRTCFSSIKQPSTDPPGMITQLDVYTFENRISSGQIHYKGCDGTYVGIVDPFHPKTLRRYDFPLPEKSVVTSVHMSFDDNGILAQLHYKFSNGTDTGYLGNSDSDSKSLQYMLDLDTTAILDETFVLAAINMAEGDGIKPPKTIYAGGIAEMTLTYLHKSLLK